MNVGQNAMRKVEATLYGGSKVLCASQGDAELVRAAEQAFYSGNPNQMVPLGTLDALRRTGMNEVNSVLFRSAMRRARDQPLSMS
jgi:hypothetical protein